MKVIITGASRGLGKSIAEACSKERHDLILIARSNTDLNSLSDKLTKNNIELKTLAADLGKRDELKELAAMISTDKTIDVLINNLGVYQEDDPEKVNLDEIDKLLRLNLHTSIELSKAVLPQMKSRKKGLIINIGSIMSTKALPHATAYSISKHALKAWNDALREEVRKYGIKITAVYPGAINTSSWDGMDANRSQMIQAEDIASLIIPLLNMNRSTLVDEINLSPLNF